MIYEKKMIIDLLCRGNSRSEHQKGVLGILLSRESSSLTVICNSVVLLICMHVLKVQIMQEKFAEWSDKQTRHQTVFLCIEPLILSTETYTVVFCLIVIYLQFTHLYHLVALKLSLPDYQDPASFF